MNTLINFLYFAFDFNTSVSLFFNYSIHNTRYIFKENIHTNLEFMFNNFIFKLKING